MSKLRSLLTVAVTVMVFCGAYYWFSKPQRIEWFSGWLQLLISGGAVITPLITYAWKLKSRYEELMGTDYLSSVEMERLDRNITKAVNNLWKLIFFYISCICITAVFMVIKNNHPSSQVIASLTITLLFNCLLSAFLLKKYDSSLHALKAAIKIRKKKNEEREKALALLNSSEEFSESERKYFQCYNNEDNPKNK